MPASLLGEMDLGGVLHHPGTIGTTNHHHSNSVGTSGLPFEDQKALRLALELSMLNFEGGAPSALLQHHHNNLMTAAANSGNAGLFNDHQSLLNGLNGLGGGHGLGEFSPAFLDHAGPDDLSRILPGKRSQNMTECVPVPSSEHVAEIVGRQGCKIKALRAKTNTYIKTPVRGEEPVFVVTGRKEDVAMAKREILSAAEHFSQIRASRKGVSGTGLSCAPTPVPGQVTIQVTVPYRVVGLVVGPKGATIKRIQQQTQTYIVTPSREKDPVFEVTGLPENVQQARREIETHIAFRTGSVAIGEPLPEDFVLGQSDILESLYKGSSSAGSSGLDAFPFDGFGALNLSNLDDIGMGLDFNLGGLGLGTINSLSSSLSSVSGLSGHGGGFEAGSSSSGKPGSVGSSTNGGGSWSSLSDLTSGFSSASSGKLEGSGSSSNSSGIVVSLGTSLTSGSTATTTTTSSSSTTTGSTGWPLLD